MFKRSLVLLALPLALSACSSKQPIQSDPWMDSPNTPETYTASSDTLTYDFLAEEGVAAADAVPAEADLPVEDTAPPSTPIPASAPAPQELAAAPLPVESAAPAASGPLFYVQIFASGNRQSAEEVALEADSRFDKPVRILFLDPYYKVLVGGFTERDDAVILRRDLTEMGYKDAWIFER